ncbi:MAG: hypothetical protein V1909_06605, partial [Candidatus Micrarchaeota archaeon]
DIRKKEIYLLKNADLVIATAPPLLETAKKYNKNVKLIQNGAEYEHFVKARKKRKRPADMPSGKPIIGYYGAIWNWFDDELLLYLAKERPNYDFVLIGTILEKLRGKFSGQKNIHYLGEKKYGVLPNYLSYFNVAIIPFKHSNLTKSVNPVKIYEYLAGGKSVVYSGLQGMADFPNSYEANERKEFLKCVDKQLGARLDSTEADKFLKNNNWKKRYVVLSRELKRI